MGQILTYETREPTQSLDITADVRSALARSGVRSGFCQIMVLHSTASVVINETADPNIGADIVNALEGAVPTKANWLHDRIDDNAHAHVKAAILGPSELVAVEDGELLLGKWQAIMLLEFDGPRQRRVSVRFLAS